MQSNADLSKKNVSPSVFKLLIELVFWKTLDFWSFGRLLMNEMMNILLLISIIFLLFLFKQNHKSISINYVTNKYKIYEKLYF